MKRLEKKSIFSSWGLLWVFWNALYGLIQTHSFPLLDQANNSWPNLSASPCNDAVVSTWPTLHPVGNFGCFGSPCAPEQAPSSHSGSHLDLHQQCSLPKYELFCEGRSGLGRNLWYSTCWHCQYHTLLGLILPPPPCPCTGLTCSSRHPDSHQHAGEGSGLSTSSLCCRQVLYDPFATVCTGRTTPYQPILSHYYKHWNVSLEAPLGSTESKSSDRAS